MTGRVMIWWARIWGLRRLKIRSIFDRLFQAARRDLMQVKGDRLAD